MPVTVLALTTLNPAEPEALETYLSVTGPLLQKAGAKVVSQREVAETIMGEQPLQFVTLVEYPDREAVSSVFESDSYRLLAPVRGRAFTQYDICILS